VTITPIEIRLIHSSSLSVIVLSQLGNDPSYCASKVRVPISKEEFRRPGELDFSGF